MPRKPLIYTPEYPYHIVARANNKEWFKGNLKDIWNIFETEFIQLNQRYNFSIHAFTLMSNHYHLIASCSQKYNLGYNMRLLQNRTAIRINTLSGRINHCYGGRYKASLITDEVYYANVLKYVFRNPVAAKLVTKVEHWPFSTVNNLLSAKDSVIPLSCHSFEKKIYNEVQDIFHWLNESFDSEDYLKIQKGLRKTHFTISQIQKRQIVFF